jgi:hypothetical protein
MPDTWSARSASAVTTNNSNFMFEKVAVEAIAENIVRFDA